LAKIYGIVAFAVSAASGGALKRKIGGIEHRCVDPPVMMLAISVRFYASVFGCGSALERTVVALERTAVVLEHTALARQCADKEYGRNCKLSQKQQTKQKRKGIFPFFSFFLFLFLLETGIK
jgi:hypothetical protein